MSLCICTAMVMELLESFGNFGKIIFIFHFLFKLLCINLCLHKPEGLSRGLSLYNCIVEFFWSNSGLFNSNVACWGRKPNFGIHGFWIRISRLYYIVINKFAEYASVAHKDLTVGIEIQYWLNKKGKKLKSCLLKFLLFRLKVNFSMEW